MARHPIEAPGTGTAWLNFIVAMAMVWAVTFGAGTGTAHADPGDWTCQTGLGTCDNPFWGHNGINSVPSTVCYELAQSPTWATWGQQRAWMDQDGYPPFAQQQVMQSAFKLCPQYFPAVP